MLGQLKFDCRGRGKAEWSDLYGLPVLRSRTDPEGWLGEHRLRRAGRSLWRCGVMRTLVPSGFKRWDLLEEYGLVPVEPGTFLRAQSLPLTLGALERQGTAPDRATVALRGLRADREMVRAAAQLCPRVRRLVISAPRGGRELANWLRWEYGVPILPEEEPGQVALCFHPDKKREEEETLGLYGTNPDLGGLNVSAPELSEEDRADLPLLAVLWEGGRLDSGKLKIT
ncbi:MAG: hypothetical protein AB7E30_06730 [Lawsonibacter sp.]